MGFSWAMLVSGRVSVFWSCDKRHRVFGSLEPLRPWKNFAKAERWRRRAPTCSQQHRENSKKKMMEKNHHSKQWSLDLISHFGMGIQNLTQMCNFEGIFQFFWSVIIASLEATRHQATRPPSKKCFIQIQLERLCNCVHFENSLVQVHVFCEFFGKSKLKYYYWCNQIPFSPQPNSTFNPFFLCKTMIFENFPKPKRMKNPQETLRSSRWWFQICFIFTLTWGNDPIWLIFFKRVVQPPTSHETRFL